MKIEEILRKVIKIRLFEKKLLELYDQGLLNGTTHTCIGQEIIPVFFSQFLNNEDQIFSNHRGHGHFLAFHEDKFKELLLEIMGKNGALLSGKGGSQHIHYKNFFSNGILAGMFPISAGSGLSNKIRNKQNISLSYIGDGAFGEGVVYETLNLLSLNNIPHITVIENNRYAQSTSIKDNLAGSIIKRIESFDIQTFAYKDYELILNFDKIKRIIDNIRKKPCPLAFVIDTNRLAPHSKGDDNRTKKEIEEANKNDALNYLIKNIQPSILKKITDEEKKYINKISVDSINSKNLVSISYSIKEIQKKNQNIYNLKEKNQKMSEIINKIIEKKINKNCVFLGEDIKSPYGGAFKISKNLSNKNSNVISTPISESAIVGLANGLTLNKYSAIVEIMFGDFITLTIDQIVNHATKFSDMYNFFQKESLIIRTPMGAGRGYGPTHSQSLEKLLFGIPNLDIYACDVIHNQTLVWEKMSESNKTSLYIENKILYNEKALQFENNQIGDFNVKNLGNDDFISLISLESLNEYDFIILTYGENFNLATKIMKHFFVEKEINIGIVLFGKLSPINSNIIKSISKFSNKFISIEESSSNFSYGSELCFQINQHKNNFKFLKIASKNSSIPSVKSLENEVIINFDKSIKEIEKYYEI